MSRKAFNLSALKQRAAWLALFAMALIIVAPLISVSLQQSPMSAMPGMHHEMSMPMPMSAHHSAPDSMPIDHGEACGYCVLLTHVPGLILALCVLLSALMLRVATAPFPPPVFHWREFPWLFPETRAPPVPSALPA
ncbi:DUF2946 domain-containing protein [Kluyvera ascorbata]|uniref:DUF2946 domain-containing protein n=2 Tax=Kluyvera ascorbata TaxID=51288 RepID=A0A3N2RUE0_9ENTR|nr:DUF2946 domain-containing protein [Kluyvera ascorbata]ROU11112.1 DUF2946 domain-containing protein [Kluyvera ascorbata]